jgi:hypothetical protein
MSRNPVLVITCRGVPFLGGAPISAKLDDEPIFLRWDTPATFELKAGTHGLDIFFEPLRYPLGANRLSRSIELNGGFRYNLTYTPRALPMLPPKIALTVDRPA